MAKYFTTPISFKHKASNGQEYPGRITGVGTKQNVKQAIAEYYYNDKVGWKEILNNEIKAELYKKYKAKIEAK